MPKNEYYFMQSMIDAALADTPAALEYEREKANKMLFLDDLGNN